MRFVFHSPEILFIWILSHKPNFENDLKFIINFENWPFSNGIYQQRTLQVWHIPVFCQRWLCCFQSHSICNICNIVISIKFMNTIVITKHLLRMIPFKGPLKTYNHWHAGQPNIGTPGDNCVAYSHDTQDWSTFPCNSTKLGWVCEFGMYTKYML